MHVASYLNLFALEQYLRNFEYFLDFSLCIRSLHTDYYYDFIIAQLSARVLLTSCRMVWYNNSR